MKNKSGFTPTRYHLIVKMEKVEDKVGNIVLPDELKTRKQFAQQTGTVVALGELAFTLGTPGTDAFRALKVQPKPGDMVLFGQYGGEKFKGLDGEEYQLLSDEQIFGVKDND